MPVRLAGLFAPVVTPFMSWSEDIDLEAFARNIRAHQAAGVGGVVVCGSTGEAALLEEHERLQLVARARTELVPAIAVIAGVGGESTRVTVRRACAAAERGADAVIVVAPHYYAANMTDAALRAHYTRVADESPIPVLLYNIPKYTHFVLSSSLVGDLADHGNVCGIKDSSGDMTVMEGYLAAQTSGFAVLTGHAATFGDALARGARGGILAAALFAPGLAAGVLHGPARGASQARLALLGGEIVGRLGVAGVKAAMDCVGLTGGSVRAPPLPLSPAERAEVGQLLAAAGLSEGTPTTGHPRVDEARLTGAGRDPSM